ncbi:unnamed protein product [Gadus morhua 'NCC']
MEGLLYKTMFKSETPGTLPQHLLKPERGLGFKAKYGTKRGFAWRQVGYGGPGRASRQLGWGHSLRRQNEQHRQASLLPRPAWPPCTAHLPAVHGHAHHAQPCPNSV